MPLQPAEFRHSMRGTMNAIKLCVSAFDMPLERAEKIEFLDDVVASAEKIVALLDQWEAEPALDTAGEETAR
jgi:hypothetical protein